MPTKAPWRARVMCIEDEPLLLMDLCEELRDAGYEVCAVDDSQTALSQAERFNPELIISDVRMPHVSGIEFLTRLRDSCLPAANVPFVLLTAYGEKSDILHARQLGADDYLVKPVDFDLLRSLIASRLQTVQRARTKPALPRSDGAPMENFGTLGDLTRLLETGRFRRGDQIVLAALDHPTRLAVQLRDENLHLARTSLADALGRIQSLQAVRVFELEKGVMAAVLRRAPDMVLTVDELQALQRLPVPPTAGEPPTLSVTVVQGACLSNSSRSPNGVLNDAMLALQGAQRDGGNVVLRLDDPSLDRLRLAQFVEANVAAALVNRGMELWFQPKFSLGNGQLIGAEALVRWRTAERGFISPALFVPIIEHMQLASRLTDWVLDAAGEAMARLLIRGHRVPIAINTSGQELNKGLPPRILSALRRYELPPDLLEVEITETSVVLDLDGAAKVTEALRQEGVHVAVDDFGTGYGSLSYLRSLPLDGVKIDQTFVRTIQHAERLVDRKIVSGIIEMARSLGMQTVAEGVETREQYDLLASLDCDAAQGFGLARPMPLADLMSFLDEGRRSGLLNQTTGEPGTNLSGHAA